MFSYKIKFYRPDSVLKKLFKMDWFLLFLIFIICIIGVGALYSAGGGSLQPWALNHLYKIILGFLIIFILSQFKINFIMNFSIIFYFRLSIPISIGMIIYSALNLYIIHQFELLYHSQSMLLMIYIAIFVGAWIGQFIGHKIEGQKPSFFEDLQFLLIGPAWLLSFIYKKLGIRY